MLIIDKILSDSEACARYKRQLQDIRSKREAIDLALSIQGIEYVAHAISRGIISPDDIADEFSQFANGAYVRNQYGYDSALFLRSSEGVVSTTAALVIQCKKVIIDNPICELYIVDCPDIIIDGYGIAVVHLYDSKISQNSDIGKIILK